MKIQQRGFVLILALLVSASIASAAQRVGRVSSSLGHPTVNGKPIGVAMPIENGDLIVTGPTDAATLLLDSKVVVKMDGDTSLHVVEAAGKTDVKIDKGTVEVFIAKRPPGAGPVALTDPDATMEAIGTVVCTTYSPATREGQYAALESFLDVKGIGDANSTHVNTGNEATLKNGQFIGLKPIDLNLLRQRLRNIEKLEKNSPRHFEARLWQRAANNDAMKVMAALALAEHGRPGTNSGMAINLTNPIDDATQNQTIQLLNSAGVLTQPSGGGGGSSGGFTDVTLVLNPGNVLDFDMIDSGIEDGDNVTLKVVSGGKTVLNRNITLKNAGENFQQAVTPGQVTMTVKALNEGFAPPNTGEVRLNNQVTSGNSLQFFDLNTGQTGTLKIKALNPTNSGATIARVTKR